MNLKSSHKKVYTVSLAAVKDWCFNLKFSSSDRANIVDFKFMNNILGAPNYVRRATAKQGTPELICPGWRYDKQVSVWIKESARQLSPTEHG